MKRPDFTFKVLLLGDGAVGKTSLVRRYVHKTFEQDYLMTVGMEPYAHSVQIDNKLITLQLWDIAGQERFANMRSMFFKGALGAILVYDITRKETLNNLGTWIKDALDSNPKMIFSMAGNKVDLDNLRQISQNEGKQYAKNKNCVSWAETSASNGNNVQGMFEAHAKSILKGIVNRS